MDEDRQEDQSSLDFLLVVATLHSLNELLEAPSESRKIHGFRTAFEDDKQPVLSYRLPVDGTSADILADIDNRILLRFCNCFSILGFTASVSTGLKGEEVMKARALNRHVTELAGSRSWDKLNNTAVILSSAEAEDEDMEAALKSIVEATSLMDWWTYVMKSLALKSTTDAYLVRRLSLAGARCQLLVTKTASTLWANVVLKRRDVVWAKVKDSISFESFMDLRNAKLSSGSDLFLTDVLVKAMERSPKVLHDEAIRKAVAQDKPQSEGKKLHFSQSHASISDCSSSSPSGRLGLWPALPSGLPPRLLLPLAEGRGRNFEGSSPPTQLQVGGALGRHWHAWQSCGANEWTLAVLQHGHRVPFHHLPPVALEPQEPPSCTLGSVRARALREEVSKNRKGALKPVDQPGPGFYSRLFLVEKVMGGGGGGGWRPVIDLSTLNGFIMVTKFQMETMTSVLGYIRKKDWMFSIDLKDVYFQIPVHPESPLFLRFCLEGRVYQFRALCFGLSTAPQVFTSVFHSGFGVGSSEGRASTPLPG